MYLFSDHWYSVPGWRQLLIDRLLLNIQLVIPQLRSNIFKGEARIRLYLEPHKIDDDRVWGVQVCLGGGSWYCG